MKKTGNTQRSKIMSMFEDENNYSIHHQPGKGAPSEAWQKIQNAKWK